MCAPGLFGAPRDNSAREARAAEEARTARIQQGMGDINSAFSGFNDNYYDQYANQNLGFWRPDIDQQYQDAQRDTLYGLARTGNTRSSAATDAYGRLREQYDRSTLEATDRARNEANNLRSRVEQSRQGVTSQLNATADPFAAAQAAQAQAQTLTAPPVYSPVGDLFSNLTAQFAVARQAGQGQTGGNWASRIFSSNPTSGAGSSRTYT